MSEVIRSYRSPKHAGYDLPFSRGRAARRAIAIALFAVVLWLYWTTRDTWPMERLVPRDQAFHLQAQHLLTSRQKAADSPLWQLGLIPEKYALAPEWLGANFGLPDWVLNNLVSDSCFVSGRDINAFSDLLVVTRMSRIGCLIERYHTFVDGIEDEYAGGLRLRRMAESDVYYAVRGRTLVFSPSRGALIRALTLREGDAVDTLENVVAASGGDIQGQILPAEDDPFGQYIAQADFVLQFTPEAIVFSSRSVVRPAWRDYLDTLLGGGGSKNLHVPEEGCVLLAADFDTPVLETWRTLDAMSGGALTDFVGGLPLLPGTTIRDRAPWQAFVDGAGAALGSRFSLRWAGFDTNGMVPMPECELYLETRGDARAFFEAIPPLEPGALPVDGVPYLDPETGTVRCPVGWGGILEPALQTTEGGIRLALHPEHLNQIPTTGERARSGEVPGALFLRIRPSEALEMLADGGRPYAEAGLIRGHTPESFQAAITEALAGSRQMREARLNADYGDGVLSIEVTLELVERDSAPAEAAP